MKSRFVAPSAMERAAVSKRIIVSKVNLVAVFILGVLLLQRCGLGWGAGLWSGDAVVAQDLFNLF